MPRRKRKRSDADPSSVNSKTTDITPADLGTSQQSSKPPSVEELVERVRNLTSIVMDLTDKQKKTKKRKRSPSISTVSSNSSTSTSEISSPSEAESEDSGDDLASQRNSRKAPCSSTWRQNKRSRKQDCRHRSSNQVRKEDRVHQSLPSISSSLLKKIKSREFIEFNLLLSRPIASPMTSNSQVAYNIQFSGKKGISVKARDPTKPAVVDLVSFLEAWNIYFEASIAFHPHLMGELLGYQKMICEYASQFKPQAWLAYDKAHRQACAVNQSLRLDVRNDQAYHRYLRDIHILPVCYICHRFGHMAATCPEKDRSVTPKPDYPTVPRPPMQPSPYHYYAPSASQSAPPSQPPPSFHSQPSQSSGQPFRFQRATPAIVCGAKFCALFNKTGRCTAGCPPESHRYNRAGCGETHPGVSCPKLPQRKP